MGSDGPSRAMRDYAISISFYYSFTVQYPRFFYDQPLMSFLQGGVPLAKTGQTVKLKYQDEDARQINEIKELVGVAKDQTAIRIALYNFHRDYVVGNNTFEPLKNEVKERLKREKDEKGRSVVGVFFR